LKYKVILFDLGSTLIEYENHDWQTLGRMGIISAHPFLKERFPDLPEAEKFGPKFYQYLREILDQRQNHSEVDLYTICNRVFARMGFNISDGIVNRFVEIYYQPVTEQITLISGAEKILDKCHSQGLILGLVSNSIFPEKFHRAEMDRFDILRYFDFTIFSSTAGTRKPGGLIFDMALTKAGVEADRAIFIGDRYDVDIVGARNAGITSVLKYREGRENPEQIEPDFTILNLNELETIIF
jgi:putative hydrolase of the HAD superfamily